MSDLNNSREKQLLKDIASQANVIPNGVSQGEALPLPVGLDKFAQYRITAEKDIPVPVPLITIDGETVCTSGNITTISGGVKSGKSAVTSWLIAGAISATGELTDSLERLKVTANPDGKAVIHFDTEQSPYKQQQNIKTVLRRCKADRTPDYFLSYNVRGLQVSECIEYLPLICCEASAACGGINMIVIDGIADFINDVNDPFESTSVVRMLMALSEQYATSIIVILHTNPGSDKERGHLGSECLRKSESVLSIKKDGDVSMIETKHMRGAGSLLPIQFIYDKEKHYHVACDLTEAGAMNKEARMVEKLKLLAEKAIPVLQCYTYAAAIESIIYNGLCGERKAKDLFKQMKAHSFIIQGDDDKWRINIETI